MRIGWWSLLWLTACGKKAPVEAPAPAPVLVAPAPAPEPDPAPEPASAARPPPSERPHNTDLMAAITFADGTNQKGKVVRIERTRDWFGDDGWTDSAEDLVVTLEGAGTEVNRPWTDIRQVDITYGAAADVDCSYDSSFEPAMYQCVLRTTTKVKTKDGKVWDGADRHQWLFVFESGEPREFTIFKLTQRKQEEATPEIGTVEENTKLYEELQDTIMKAKAGKVPRSITITVP